MKRSHKFNAARLCKRDDHENDIFEKRLFADNIELFLQRERVIRSRPEYFFVRISFANCCVGMSALGVTLLAGQFHLGQLLMGWNDAFLTDLCPNCPSVAFITSFGANLSRWSNWWYGFCLDCRQWARGSSNDLVLSWRMAESRKLLQEFPDSIEVVEQYASYSFGWSGDGLCPVTRTRRVIRPLHNPVALGVLIEELRSDVARAPKQSS